MALPHRAATAPAASLRVLPMPERGAPLEDTDTIPRPDHGLQVREIPRLRVRACLPQLPDDDDRPETPRLEDLPDPREFAGYIAVNLWQVAAGARPAPQVMRFTAPKVYASLVRRQGRVLRAGTATRRPTRLRSVVMSSPRPGVVDAAVAIEELHRTHAMALRLVAQDRRWIVTVLEIG